MDGSNALFVSFDTADKAEAYDMERMDEGYDSRTVGEIGGDAYLVIYTRPKKATKRAKGCRDTSPTEKGPQKATQGQKADLQRCRDCPECMLLFDTKGIYGYVPDGNRRTCQSCERNKGAEE